MQPTPKRFLNVLGVFVELLFNFDLKNWQPRNEGGGVLVGMGEMTYVRGSKFQNVTARIEKVQKVVYVPILNFFVGPVRADSTYFKRRYLHACVYTIEQ